MVLLVVAVLASGAVCPRHKEPDKAWIITVNWDLGKSLKTWPSYHIRGELVNKTTPISEKRQMGGITYEGDTVFLEEGTRGEVPDPDALLLEFLLGRSEVDPAVIEVHFMTKVPVILDFENFQGGILQEPATGNKIIWPAEFGPGTYHLQALKGPADDT